MDPSLFPEYDPCRLEGDPRALEVARLTRASVKETQRPPLGLALGAMPSDSALPRR